jgi:hypothetical protein
MYITNHTRNDEGIFVFFLFHSACRTAKNTLQQNAGINVFNQPVLENKKRLLDIYSTHMVPEALRGRREVFSAKSCRRIPERQE